MLRSVLRSVLCCRSSNTLVTRSWNAAISVAVRNVRKNIASITASDGPAQTASALFSMTVCPPSGLRASQTTGPSICGGPTVSSCATGCLQRMQLAPWQLSTPAT